MGFAAFVRNPKSYLSLHRAMIQDTPASAAASVAQAGVVLPNAKTRMEFQQDPASFITMIHMVGHGAPIHSSAWSVTKAAFGGSRIYRSFSPIASANDIGFRYLPFRANHCTYMTLDGAATFWITGPLTGCTVAVARHGGALRVFHSNDNVGAGAAARLTQRQSITETCNLLGIPVGAVSYCEYLTHYDGFGFVFGRPRGNVWKFYAHATDVAGTTRTSKWAEV